MVAWLWFIDRRERQERITAITDRVNAQAKRNDIRRIIKELEKDY